MRTLNVGKSVVIAALLGASGLAPGGAFGQAQTAPGSDPTSSKIAPADAFGAIAKLAGKTYGRGAATRKVYLADQGRELVIESHRLKKDVLRVTETPQQFKVIAHSDVEHQYHVEPSFRAYILQDGALAVEYQTVNLPDVSIVTVIYRVKGSSLLEEVYTTHLGVDRLRTNTEFPVLVQ